MDIKRLKEIIKDLPDDTDVLIHRWTQTGSVFSYVNQAVNYDWQAENKTLLFSEGLEKSRQ